MTHGDIYNCKCPYCGRVNHYITQEKAIPADQVTEFTKPCDHCGKNVYYWARWAITLEAEQEGKVN